MIRVAFTLLGRGRWTGGEVYLKNMLAVIQSRLTNSVAPILFITPDEAAKLDGSLDSFLPEPAVVLPEVAHFGRRNGLWPAMLSGYDKSAAKVFLEHNCDIAFESALFLGWRFPLPTVAWIPDFQHRLMPEMFPRGAWWRRELGFRMQFSTHRIIMLSSKTAREDAKHFYWNARTNTSVVRFAQMIDPGNFFEDSSDLMAKYNLPKHYVFLPNQFWKHKNHLLVIDAYRKAIEVNCLHRMPHIVMSGRQDDPRNPGVYFEFTQQLASLQVEDKIRHLGLIPYHDVLRLVASADAVLNPSHFEGWSTPVEEAKALGARLILSDIRIHREQAPHAQFFDPRNALALMNTLLAVPTKSTLSPQDIRRLCSDQSKRIDDYASALLAVFTRTNQQTK